nr:hypothetical protein [Tanacetum cinerariifolium]
MARPFFNRIVTTVTNYDPFCHNNTDCSRREGNSPLIKCTSAIRQLAYDVNGNFLDEYMQIIERSSRMALDHFCEAVMEIYGPEFLRKPTVTDIEKLYRHYEEKHGFLEMLGSLDCTDWEWFGCPYAFKGQYVRRDHSSNLFNFLEAVASGQKNVRLLPKDQVSFFISRGSSFESGGSSHVLHLSILDRINIPVFKKEFVLKVRHNGSHLSSRKIINILIRQRTCGWVWITVAWLEQGYMKLDEYANLVEALNDRPLSQYIQVLEKDQNNDDLAFKHPVLRLLFGESICLMDGCWAMDGYFVLDIGTKTR